MELRDKSAGGHGLGLLLASSVAVPRCCSGPRGVVLLCQVGCEEEGGEDLEKGVLGLSACGKLNVAKAGR